MDKEKKLLMVGRVIIVIGLIPLLGQFFFSSTYLFDPLKLGILSFYPIWFNLLCTSIGIIFTWGYPMLKIISEHTEER
jgi:hypothetical protein